tara:strand:- start:367 stop:936 length:570 start_codon:yes stop_codon:yes gene_type:complete
MAQVPSKYMKSIAKATKGRPKSTEWFRDKIREFGQPSAMQLIRDGKQNTRPFYGNLNMFFYDPKFKKTLPYYDRFPLVLPIERYSNGFLGINLHYLPIPLRIRLLDTLMEYSTDTNFDSRTKLKVLGRYKNLKNVALLKPTIKRYLRGHVKSSFRKVEADEFVVATLLPVQRFSKANEKKVWSDSRSMI